VNRLFLRDFLTGITALAALVGLIGLLIFFGEITPQLVARDYQFMLRVANAQGLDDTSPVTLNGVRVGQVKKSVVGDGTSELATGATLTVTVRSGVRIPKSAKVSVDKGFVGGSTLEFSTDGLAASQLVDAIKQDDIIDGGSPQTFLDSIQNIVSGPMGQFSDTAARINALADEWTKVGQRINDLVEPRTLADVQAGKPANIPSSLARLDGAVQKAESWLGDSQLRARIDELLTKADRVVAQTNELTITWTNAGKTADQTIKDVGEQAKELTQSAKDLLAKANDSLANVKTAGDDLTALIERVNQGQGTLGQLLTNQSLYQNLDAAALRLDQALKDAQQVLEKLKQEGVQLKVGL
jgi:phospholipid/cholesterol/gamma-HCH transport system substrate-binding protein